MKNRMPRQPASINLYWHARRWRPTCSRPVAWLWPLLLAALALSAWMSALSVTPAAAADSTIFPPNPSPGCPPQSYIVPEGVYLVRVVAIGGRGQAGTD